MWKQISQNKRNSLLVFIAMSLVLFVAGATLGYFTLSANEYGIVTGALVAMSIYWALVVTGKQKSLPISVGGNVRKCEKDDNPKLYNIVEEMSIAAGLPNVPDIYIMDTSTPNAFACGYTPQKSCVCVTTGLMELCNRDELQGVVAHEIAHIVNRDTSYLLYASVILVMLSTLTRAFSHSGSRRSSSGNAAGMLLLMLLISSLICNLLYFLLSRKREFLADACAAQFTRYPAGLASALNKISKVATGEPDESKNTSSDGMQFQENPYLKASCIVPALSSSSLFQLFSTHPSTEDRIKILMLMTSGADFASYNEAYSSVTKEVGVISQSDVSACGNTPIRIGEPMVGLATLTGCELTPEIKKIENDEHIERRREVEDLMWKYEGYIFVNCHCGTILKFPPSFKGKEAVCPHCKSKHVVS